MRVWNSLHTPEFKMWSSSLYWKRKIWSNGRKAVVDINGKILSTGLYDRISYLDDLHIIERGHFDTDILITEKNSLLGYISSSEQDIIDCKYGFVDFFQDGYSWCSDGKKNALLNTKGELISPFIYDYVRYCGETISETGSLAIFLYRGVSEKYQINTKNRGYRQRIFDI